jgi:hypothetical protein
MADKVKQSFDEVVTAALKDHSGNSLLGYVVKFAGLSTAETDSDASVVISLTGAAATDIGFAVYAAGANAVYVTKVVMSTNTMTVTLSGNGGAGTQVAYQVLRAWA